MDYWESPVASVNTSLSSGDITSLLLHLFLVTKGPTKLSKCSNRSGDILIYLLKYNYYNILHTKFHMYGTGW